MNQMFDGLFPSFRLADGEVSMWDWHPAVDVIEHDENIVIQAELPGIEKKDIMVDLKGKVLTLKGERSVENEVKEDGYHRLERAFGKFERRFNLPAEIDPETIKADYKDGVLKIDIPKPKESLPKKITVH
jgi:HSP20 family protein